jgi:hypothetical protein
MRWAFVLRSGRYEAWRRRPSIVRNVARIVDAFPYVVAGWLAVGVGLTAWRRG